MYYNLSIERGEAYRSDLSKQFTGLGVIAMKHDLLSGILYGVVIGLFFTAQLSAHLPLLVIVAVLFGAKMISLK